MIPKGYIKIPIRSIGVGFRRKIVDDLTIVGRATSSFQKEDVVHHLYVETADYIGVPRGYYLSHLKMREVDGVFSFSDGGVFVHQDAGFSLREGQDEIISSAHVECEKNGYGGCIIEAGVGSGKTVIGLELARRLGKKTIIIVSTTVLLKQWEAEIKRFFPKWRVGVVRSDKVEVRGYDICIGMLQSLSLKDDYPEWLYEEFGTILVDECHLVGSPEFSKAIPKFSAKYIIGLSGTVKRADKCENVFVYNSGPILPFMNTVKTMQPHIYFVDTGFAWSGWRAALDRQRVKYLEKLVGDPARNLLIVRQAAKAAKTGRSILILTERVDHARGLANQLNIELDGTGLTVGVMVGSSSEKERVESQQANIIVATSQLVGTGFNEPRLSVLIFATPIQNITQCVGRVVRQHPNKPTPFVLDLVDTRSEVGLVFAKSRFKKYLEKNYEMFNIACLGKDFLWKFRDHPLIRSKLQSLRHTP